MDWRRCCDNHVGEAIAFLTDLEEESHLTGFPDGIAGTTYRIYHAGTILLAWQSNELVGFLAYYLDPAPPEFAVGPAAYVYLLVVHPSRRHLHSTMLSVLRALCRFMGMEGFVHARFKAEASDLYVNRLYRKIAALIGTELNSQGLRSNVYWANVADWCARFSSNHASPARAIRECRAR